MKEKRPPEAKKAKSTNKMFHIIFTCHLHPWWSGRPLQDSGRGTKEVETNGTNGINRINGINGIKGNNGMTGRS